jgi:MoxR-like ATPase
MTHGPTLWEHVPSKRPAPLRELMDLAPLFYELAGEAADVRAVLDDFHPDLAPLILELAEVSDGPLAEAMREWEFTVDHRHRRAWRLPGTPRPLGMDQAADASAAVLNKMAARLRLAALALRQDAARMTTAYGAMTAGKALFLEGPDGAQRVAMAKPEAPAA